MSEAGVTHWKLRKLRDRLCREQAKHEAKARELQEEINAVLDAMAAISQAEQRRRKAEREATK